MCRKLYPSDANTVTHFISRNKKELSISKFEFIEWWNDTHIKKSRILYMDKCKVQKRWNKKT